MPLEPTLAEVIRGAIDGKLIAVHTALPGRVKTYDRTKQVADIIPVIRGVIFTEDDEPVLEDLPVIPNVPVGWLRGGGYSLQFPLNPGDHVLLVFSEAATGQWRSTGQTSEPGDLRRHDLSYPFAIPCCAPDADALDAIGADEAVIDGPTAIRLGGEASAIFVALAAKVDAAIAAIVAAFNAHTHITNTAVAAFGPTNPGTAAPTTPPLAAQPSVTATKVKAE